jgi:hypothetical protein
MGGSRGIAYSPLVSQKKFLDSTARFKGFSGPIGSGKSQALCQEALKLTYLNPGRTGLLQGWALLHNDTDEDWRGGRVELVNGRPDSFLFPVAAPRYARRELVPPANGKRGTKHMSSPSRTSRPAMADRPSTEGSGNSAARS